MAQSSSRLKDLIAVAKEGSSEKRRDLLRDITDVFMTEPDRYTSSEMQHFDVIMSRVTEEVETALRRELAEKLADVPSAPPTLIRQLARDEISVAEPVLRRSEALSEEDLVGVIRQRGQEHMAAISKRNSVGEKVTSELVERGGEDVLVSLAGNQGAKFSTDSMEKMVDHSRSIRAMQKPMMERFDLPPKLLTKMYFFVSSALKREILKRSDMLDPALIDEAVSANRARILDEAVREAKAEVDNARKFIADKARANEVNESLLKELIESKKATAFLYAFSHVAGIDTSTAQAILKDRTWESIAIASRAAGLERATFAKIVFGLQRDGAEQNKALRILDLYLKIPVESAERVMRFWRVRSQSAAARHERRDDKDARRVTLNETADRAAG
ncbi:MAG: DUF2336 domain-containing protein [Pseudomonadota bacterium]